MLTGKAKGRGFTLIELLVVIAVIATLMAILVTSLANAKEIARRVVCSNTVHQFIIGTLLYADGYDRMLPSGQSESGRNMAARASRPHRVSSAFLTGLAL